jgi:hypothetical protein
MTIRSAVRVAVLAAVGAGLTGCPSDSCPLESPKVSATPGTCTEVAGQPVSYPVRLCPSCNQTGATCVANLSDVGAGSGSIFLDTKMEACSGGNSCPPPSCDPNPFTCAFTAPSTPGTYQVIVVDGATGTPITGQLSVVAPGTPESCVLAAVGP